MSVWQTSRDLSAKSWGIVKSNRELLRFPVRGAVIGVVAGGIFILPALVVLALSDGRLPLIVAGVALFLVGIYLAAYAVIRHTAGLVSAADDILHDRETSYEEAMGATGDCRSALRGWAGISCTVGVLLAAIRGDGSDGSLAITIIRMVAAGIVATAWQLITFFALPVIVLERSGAVGAMKRSASIVKDRWGTAVVGTIRITVRAALWFSIPGVILVVAGVVLALTLANAVAIAAGIVLGLAGLTLILVGAVLASAARTVFGVALYRYAIGGPVGTFTESELEGALRYKGQGKRAA